MLDLQLREEFQGKKLKGTTVDFTNQSKTGALEVPATEFLRITYPSFDLLKTVDAIGPGQSRPVVLMGPRGQGKSHLLAALYHLCTNPVAGKAWLNEWSERLGPDVGALQLRDGFQVIAESLHHNEHKFLWDILFARLPNGQKFLGKWEGMGEKKSDIPSYSLLVEMFTEQPTILILDECQTWFDGLSNNAKQKAKSWAFNFVQILTEIADKCPHLLALVVSVRDGNNEAFQQIHRSNPVLVDFKGPLAKRDRQRLLLHRIFENRMQVPPNKIEAAIQTHLGEYFRLAKIPQHEQGSRQTEFIEAWPYAPHLLRLLEDQVLIATDTQGTRDLIKILIDLFKTVNETQPIITAADCSLVNEKSGVASLLDAVANQLFKDLRQKAIRNLDAVREAVPKADREVPNLGEIISALWLRSLTVDRLVGAEPAELQIDITRGLAIDDNRFQAELATIEENSFNIHRIGTRLVFKNEENPQAKLLAHAKNDKLFPNGEDVDHLAKEIRAVIGGQESVSRVHQVIVLKRKWQSDPWSEFDEKSQPKDWNDRHRLVVIPEYPEKLNTTLGEWLVKRLQEQRNTIRFLLPQKGTDPIYNDRELLVLARAIHLAMKWRKDEPAYADLQRKFQTELTAKLKNRFDRTAILTEWNFGEPAKCRFEEFSHGAIGEKIPDAVDTYIKDTIFEPEEFEEHVKLLAANSDSVGKLLKDLREPRPGGQPCIPWLGEEQVKERVVRMCAAGQIAINVRGLKMLQARPDENPDDAWNRMKGELGSGKHLDETTLHMPDSVVMSGGRIPVTTTQPGTPSAGGLLFPADPDTGNPLAGSPPIGSTPGDSAAPGNLFGGTTGPVARTPHSAAPTSGLNLLGPVDSWGIGPGTNVVNVAIKIPKMNGAQLKKLLKELPDGFIYGLELEKETT